MITQPELETLESNVLNIAQMRLLLLFCEAIRRNLTRLRSCFPIDHLSQRLSTRSNKVIPLSGFTFSN